jgi:catechol 2,3-dioxygenase-like lactoylglutathione lyase family enzyme
VPKVQQILETALEVADVKRSEQFYRDLFGFPTIFAPSDRLHVLSIHDRQVLLLFQRGGSVDGAQTPNGFIPGHEASGTMHMAFAISPGDVEPWRVKLLSLNIPIESETAGPMGGGHAIYFRDPDQHLIELATPTIWGFVT